MARVTFSGIITGMRGSEGGITFQRNLSGTIVRGRIKPINVRTPYTATSRNNIAYMGNYWFNLTEAQRGVWNAAAPSGQSGYSYFQSQNQNALKIQQAITDIPFTPTPITPISYIAAADNGTGVMSITLSALIPGVCIGYLSISKPLSAGVRIRPSSVRFITLLNPGTLVQYVDTFYLDKFGFFPPAGASLTFALQIINVNTLNALTPSFQSIIVT